MDKNVQSIERASKILECFSLDKPVLSFTELVKGTNLSKSTLSRLLSTLLNLEYIKQDHLTEKYSLGFKLFNLGSIVSANISLRKVALPHMHQLCEELKETISLNIIERDERVYLEMVESPEDLRNFVKVGQRNSLFSGASGKLLLAFTEAGASEKLIENNIVFDSKQRKDLKEELAIIRDKGYVFMEEGRVKGTFVCSAPIFDHTNKCSGSLTVAGPIHRLQEKREDYIITRTLETCSSISRELGCRK